MELETNRAGILKRMQSDYECFIPHALKDLKILFQCMCKKKQ